MTSSASSRSQSWPNLPLEAWSDTYATLHMWTQIVGKIRLTQSPWINHSWHVTLYLTARGLSTSPIPHGTRTFQVDFDFIGHHLTVQSSDGGVAGFPLQPQSVAVFYRRLMEEMAKLDLRVDIDKRPNEVPDAIRFDQDEAHHAYDPEYANRFWRALVEAIGYSRCFGVASSENAAPYTFSGVHRIWRSRDFRGVARPNIRAVFPTCRTG